MTMTDPIADMLTRVRNANSAHKDAVSMPFSKLKSHIAEILEAEGYIAGWTVEDAEVGKTLTVNLKYGPNRERSIAGVRRVSKPGLRPRVPPKRQRGGGCSHRTTSDQHTSDTVGRPHGIRRLAAFEQLPKVETPVRKGGEPT